MIRYLLVMTMIILTPPKGNGGMPLAPKPAVVEARVWDMAGGSGASPRRAMDASCGGAGIFLWID